MFTPAPQKKKKKIVNIRKVVVDQQAVCLACVARTSLANTQRLPRHKTLRQKRAVLRSMRSGKPVGATADTCHKNPSLKR